MVNNYINNDKTNKAYTVLIIEYEDPRIKDAPLKGWPKPSCPLLCYPFKLPIEY
jgi:hypothetical protein